MEHLSADPVSDAIDDLSAAFGWTDMDPKGSSSEPHIYGFDDTACDSRRIGAFGFESPPPA